MKTVFTTLLYGLNAMQVAQVSNQAPQVSNQVAQVSDQQSQVSDQQPQVSNQVLQISNQTAQVSDQVAQVSDQVPQVYNQTAQVSDQVPQDSNQEIGPITCEDGVCMVDLFDGGFLSNQHAACRENENYPDVLEFTGIKFADSERFMSPVAINDYEDTDFSNPGYSCANVNAVNVGAESLPVSTDRIEDCLYIRIWVKKSAMESGATRRKVMSWIHGGTFNFGGVDVLYENPAKFVDEQDVIVAKMNYRLGPFGNWYMPMRTDGQPKGGLSTLDQRAGLKWIHEHIGKFNGDAHDITLGGASAGGMSVMIHMTSPASHQYFHNVLTIGVPQIKFWNETEAGMAYGGVTMLTGCTTEDTMMMDLADGSMMDCLKNMPLEEFQGACTAGEL